MEHFGSDMLPCRLIEAGSAGGLVVSSVGVWGAKVLGFVCIDTLVGCPTSTIASGVGSNMQHYVDHVGGCRPRGGRGVLWCLCLTVHVWVMLCSAP